MYHTIVKRIATKNFERVNQHDYAAILKDCVPDIHHRFGGHHALGPDVAGGEHAKRPGPGRREEPEPAVLAERHLGHEIPAGVEQARVADRHRRSVPGDPALHHGLGSGVRRRAHLRSAGRRPATIGGHLPSPTSIGTPTREPYSVHDPS